MCGGLIICDPASVLFFSILINTGIQGLSHPGQQKVFLLDKIGSSGMSILLQPEINFPFSIDDDILTNSNLANIGVSTDSKMPVRDYVRKQGK